MANVSFYADGSQVRISKFGQDARPGGAQGRNMLFDSNWEQGMTVHKQVIVAKGTTTVSFDQLSYIPFVYLATVNASGSQYFTGKKYDLDGAKVYANKVVLPGGRDNPTLVCVFRAKAFDTAQQAGYVGARCPRVLMGKGGANVNRDYGFFVSRKGYNVLTCLESDLIYSSSRRIPGIIYAATHILPKSSWTGGSYSELKALTLKDPGYQPLAMVEVSEPGKNQIYYPNNKGLDSGDDIETSKVDVDVSITFDSSANPNKLSLNFDGDNAGGNPGNVYVRVTLFDIQVK